MVALLAEAVQYSRLCLRGALLLARLPAFSSGLSPRRLLRSCPCTCGRASASSVNLGFVQGLAWPVAKPLRLLWRTPSPLQKHVATWSVETVLRWKGRHHINVLELSAFGALLRRVAREAPDSRVTTLLDSVVAKAAAAKGRSASFALSPALAKACAVQLAFGIYTAFGFAPTRLNTADPPSRSRPLETAGGLLLSSCLPPEALRGLGELRFRRAFAPWARLVLVAVLSRGPPSQLLCDVLAGRHAALPATGTLMPVLASLVRAPALFPTLLAPHLSFSPSRSSPIVGLEHRPFGLFLLASFCFSFATALFITPAFGFGLSLPRSFLLTPSYARLSTPPLASLVRGWLFGWLLFWGSSGLQGVLAMDLSAPPTPADARRAELRRPLQLVADRVIRPVTRANRADFDHWLRSTQDTTLARLLETPWEHAERISAVLVLFGQQLFRIGAPYYRYSETINGVAAARPGMRRSLSAAWDLAFAWLSEGPHAHHRALPKGVLLAILSAALTRGWLLEAGLFALAWSGLL